MHDFRHRKSPVVKNPTNEDIARKLGCSNGPNGHVMHDRVSGLVRPQGVLKLVDFFQSFRSKENTHNKAKVLVEQLSNELTDSAKKGKTPSYKKAIAIFNELSYAQTHAPKEEVAGLNQQRRLLESVILSTQENVFSNIKKKTDKLRFLEDSLKREKKAIEELKKANYHEYTADVIAQSKKHLYQELVTAVKLNRPTIEQGNIIARLSLWNAVEEDYAKHKK